MDQQLARQLSVLHRGNLHFVSSSGHMNPHVASFRAFLRVSLLQLVQTVVIIFHRQWLDLRGCQEPTVGGSGSVGTLEDSGRCQRLVLYFFLPQSPAHQGARSPRRPGGAALQRICSESVCC